jgi:hypothetical protein
MKVSKLLTVKEYLNLLIKQQSNIDRMIKHESSMSFSNVSEKKRNSMRHKIDAACEERNRTEHELHCLIVEAGLGEPRPDDHYGERIERPNGWHEVKRFYRRPNI